MELANILDSPGENKIKVMYCHVIGEGNSTPLQYSCLENPMDGGAGRLPSMRSLGVGHD